MIKHVFTTLNKTTEARTVALVRTALDHDGIPSTEFMDAVTRAFDEVVREWVKLGERVADIEADDRKTPLAQSEAVTALMDQYEREAGRIIAKAGGTARALRTDYAAQLERKLRAPDGEAPDPVTAADLRGVLRGLDAPEVQDMTTSDPRWLAAILAAPPEAAGLDAGKVDRIRQQVITRFHDADRVRLEVLAELVELTEAMESTIETRTAEVRKLFADRLANERRPRARVR